MTRDLGNGHRFLIYHLRSAHMMFEALIEDFLSEKELSREHFYILRCDWSSLKMTFDELSAHSILDADKARKAIHDLISKEYVTEGTQGGVYSLTREGASIREHLLVEYRLKISQAVEGLPDEAIEVALSTLLRFQNNLQKTDCSQSDSIT